VLIEQADTPPCHDLPMATETTGQPVLTRRLKLASDADASWGCAPAVHDNARDDTAQARECALPHEVRQPDSAEMWAASRLHARQARRRRAWDVAKTAAEAVLEILSGLAP
jgi:hypothetical protein